MSATSRNTKPFVMVVDDDPMICMVTVMALEQAGYDSRAFRDPIQALGALAKSEPAPRVLVADYYMPGMNGSELITRSREICPKLKTVLISGGIIPPEASADVRLKKAYLISDIGQTVRDLLK